MYDEINTCLINFVGLCLYSTFMIEAQQLLNKTVTGEGFHIKIHFYSCRIILGKSPERGGKVILI